MSGTAATKHHPQHSIVKCSVQPTHLINPGVIGLPCDLAKAASLSDGDLIVLHSLEEDCRSVGRVSSIPDATHALISPRILVKLPVDMVASLGCPPLPDREHIAIIKIAESAARAATSIVLAFQKPQSGEEDNINHTTAAQLNVILKGVALPISGEVHLLGHLVRRTANIIRAIPSGAQFYVCTPRTTLTLGAINDAEAVADTATPVQTTDSPLDPPLRQLADILLEPFSRNPIPGIDVSKIAPTRGVLLSGPPGVGKTYLVSRFIDHAQQRYPSLLIKLVSVVASDITSGVLGESERRIRQVFATMEDFTKGALAGQPRLAILFIDEIDALCERRGSASSTHNRIVTQLLTLMDGARMPEYEDRKAASCWVVVGATNRVETLDLALRRPGRFDAEIRIPPPDESQRLDILRQLTASLHVPEKEDRLVDLAKRTVGFVPADLQAVVREIQMTSSDDDFFAEEYVAHALAVVGASAMREYRSSIDRVTWDDIGGLADAKAALMEAVEMPLIQPEKFERMRIRMARGILLHGPPGNSKTTLIRALANAVNASFFALSGADIISAFVGEAERQLRSVFQRARDCAPAIVFLDEIDSMIGKRGIGGSSDGSNTGLLATLLTEIDGIQAATNVIVVGATNRKEALDPALIRSGRLEVHIFIPNPDMHSRLQILQVKTKHISLGGDVDLPAISAATEGWSGAEVVKLCREAAMEALRETLDATVVCMRHFTRALSHHKH